MVNLLEIWSLLNRSNEQYFNALKFVGLAFLILELDYVMLVWHWSCYFLTCPENIGLLMPAF